MTLAHGQVHIWRVALDRRAAHLQQFMHLLSADEQERAARLYLERDRRRFIVGRGVLRTILGRYLGIEPHQVQFSYKPHGKPYLTASPGQMALQFNAAHSHELALYAFAWGCQVGIDVEYVHLVPDAEEIAARFFSVRENAALRLLPEEQRQMGFFYCWTRKEAYIKAIGDGLSYPLDRFDVSLGGEEGLQSLDIDGDPGESGRWSLQAFIPAPGYVAALAVEGHDWQPVYWQYPEVEILAPGLSLGGSRCR